MRTIEFLSGKAEITLSHPERLPARIRSFADLEQLEAAAEKIATRCGDGTMVWRVWGTGDPIVMLHGGSGSWTHWVRNVSVLTAAGRRVLVPDLPGFGESAVPPGGKDADVLPEPLYAGLCELLVGRSFDLVGFSFGGLVGGLFTRQYQALVRRLVLVGAPALGVARTQPLDLLRWRHLPDARARDKVHRHNLAVLMLADPDSIDEFAVTLHGANVACDRMQNRRLHRSDILLRSLGQIRCPVFGIWGSEDALYQDRALQLEQALGHAPGFRWLTWIPGAGHWVQFERSEAFDAALAAALRST